MDDAACIQAVLQGDAGAFEDLVRRHQTRVYNMAYRMVGPNEAEDAAQEAFLRAYTQLATFKPEHRFDTWILAITAHHCIDLLRRRKRQSEGMLVLAHEYREPDVPEAIVAARDASREVHELLAQLPPGHRAVLVLYYWHDLSCGEIGQLLGLSETCVRVRLHRARHMLAGRLAAHGSRISEEVPCET